MRYVALALALLGCGGDETPSLPPACEAPVHGTTITFREVARTKSAALLVTSPPNDVRRFVLERDGLIEQLTDTGISPTLFLDVSNIIQAGGEQGLLGLAFHPKYASNGTFFVFYTTADANVLARYTVSKMNPEVADPASAKVVLSIPDFAGNHNGGMIEFGKDGYLYIGTGDGGGGGDPMKTGQNPNALLGKILRIDVDKKEGGKEYGIPSGNPYAKAGGAPEVLIMGVRNPWRWSFDRTTGDLWIGDVGQDAVEELNVIPTGKAAGMNLGWSMYEGANCYSQPCDPAGMAMPAIQKTHSGDAWCAVIAGQVYRGSCYPDVVGTHYMTDYCAHELVAVKQNGTALAEEKPTTHYADAQGIHDGVPPTPSSLHADARGELYLTTEQVSGSQTQGGIFHLEAGM